MTSLHQSVGHKRFGKISPDRSGYGFDFSKAFLLQHLDTSRPFQFRISGQKLRRWLAGWLLVAGLCLPGGRAQAESAPVGQWDVFELALPGPTNGNPFVDVTFSAQFAQGANLVTANGFYDGDGVYRVRFMPAQTGEWNYVTHSATPLLDGRTGRFTVTPPGPGNHGPVRVAHTYHFAYADGTSYQELGTTCYAWIQQPDALEDQTLKSLATAPFNKLRMCVFPKWYDWNRGEPILYPYAGSPTNHWDFTRFNPHFFQHLDQRVRYLQTLGIEADVILFHPYDGGHWGFDRMPPDADDRYLRYVVARLSAYRNVWWSLANEWDIMKKKSEGDFVRFGEIIVTNDPYHHLISIHNQKKYFNHALPWISHVSVQNGAALEEAGRAELYRDEYHKPVVFDEARYEGDIPNRWGRLSAEEMVFRFWEATVAGTYAGHGETYLSPDNILWWSKGGVLKGRSPARLAFLKRVLAESPPEGIEPVAGWPNAEAGGQPGKYYLIYFGKNTPSAWEFLLPAAGGALAEGMKFKAEILDTWNMTVTPVDRVFTIQPGPAGFFNDHGRSIDLPGQPYVALRLTRVF
jgi:hypothetical protein